MSTQLQSLPKPVIDYPDCDGNPMSDNTLQFEWIVTLKGGIEAMFRNDPNVFVAGDLLWYPVEGNNAERAAPDVLVAFGRPKGYRGSYMQWKEGGIAPQVVFEVLSPSNRYREMVEKFRFYERYGVEEYYVFDPDNVELEGWIREGDSLTPVADINGWTSARLGVRFDLSSGNLQVFSPDGRPFETYVQVVERAELDRRRAEQQQHLAEQERQRVLQLEAQLRALGIDPAAPTS